MADESKAKAASADAAAPTTATAPAQTDAQTAEQDAIDQERGFRRIEWKPGVWLLQALAGQHTEPDTEAGELNMRAHVNERRLSEV